MKSPVDVCELVNGVLALCQGELEAHGILLCSEMHDALPEVMAAHMQLQQVVLNLIMNAVEAMSAIIGRDRCLTITAKPEGKSSVMIGIEDTGTGIDPVYLDRIFEPFFTTKSQGMGMGLAICRSIIETHSGRLTVSPRRPFGTSFFIVLPTVLNQSGNPQ